MGLLQSTRSQLFLPAGKHKYGKTALLQ